MKFAVYIANGTVLYLRRLLRYVFDLLKLRTLQCHIKNIAAIDAHCYVYYSGRRRCVRLYLHKRGSSLLVRYDRASSKASTGGTGIIRFHAFFCITVNRLTEPQTLSSRHDSDS